VKAMGVMKRLHTTQMLRAPAPVEMPDVVALPRCKCGCRHWTLTMSFGVGNGKAAHGCVDAECTQCGESRRVHEYKGAHAYEAAFGLLPANTIEPPRD
jgi:hypothetical protein